ncbi:MAG: (4Fe-4S)-binding protein [Candidatus Altiarchaeales archaeon WOR_SM1_86-2]|nr:MAG: (4Fe-4S)-binding protein [Candidatus Altiarchaeales archaeon WOR_SM1_86-2]ODS41711.1 MAG: (4Fe-4S)-binding protein [Candidatus Altiarchaeales archaeon WOR_SM1_79]
MIISIASGKGGTGKTTVAVNLALSLKNVQFIDCDVEEPNAHIFLKPEIKERKNAFIPVPEIDKEKCTYCRKCAEACEFNAIAILPGNFMLFKELCHGCGLCAMVCPENAITEKNREIGVIEKGKANGIEFVHGILNIGEAMSSPLISSVKDEIDKNSVVIVDAPPGASCPVIESLNGSDYCILVTEPTPFGLYDLKIAVGVLEKLEIPHGVIINRDGIGDRGVEKFCSGKKIPVLLKIPYDKTIAELYSKGTPFVLEMPEWKKKFREIFEKIKHEKR